MCCTFGNSPFPCRKGVDWWWWGSGRLVVVGFGKASAAMAQALEPLVADTLSSGLVITKYGHGVPLQRIEVVEAGHPLLDENGLQGTRKLLHLVESLTENDVVICWKPCRKLSGCC